MKWPVSPLGEVATLERVSIQPDSMLSGTLYVGLENIESGGNFADVRWVNAGELASSKFAFTDRHLLYGKLRPYLRKVARPTFAGICSTDILPIFAGPHLDRNFLHNFLLLDSSVEFAVTRSTGANLPRISPRILETLPVPLPPLKEQRRIAAILDQAEALRAKRRQALAKLDTLTQSLFLEMFDDPESNPKGWLLKKLVDVCSVITDGEHQTPKRSTDGFKLLSARNVRNGYLDFSDVDYVDEVEFARIVSRCRPQRNDVLISCSGTIGRVSAIRTDEGLCLVRSAALLRARGDTVDSDFLEGWLLQPWMTRTMMRRANASGQPNLFQNQIKELPVLLPALSSQREFGIRSSAIREERLKQQAALDAADKLSASLQHRAFRGEL